MENEPPQAVVAQARATTDKVTGIRLPEPATLDAVLPEPRPVKVWPSLPEKPVGELALVTNASDTDWRPDADALLSASPAPRRQTEAASSMPSAPRERAKSAQSLRPPSAPALAASSPPPPPAAAPAAPTTQPAVVFPAQPTLPPSPAPEYPAAATKKETTNSRAPGEPEAGTPMADAVAMEQSDEESRPPVVISGVVLDEPPQLIERPTPVDTSRQLVDLAFLLGLQIGHGEIDDALVTLELLRKLDPAMAAEAFAALKEREAELAEADAVKKAAAEAEASASVQPDKYYMPLVEQRPLAEYADVESAETGSGTQPGSAPAHADPSAAATSLPPSTTAPFANVEPMEIYVSPPYTGDSPPPHPSVHAFSAPTPPSQGYSVTESAPADAPAATGATPATPPPTLWERSNRRDRGGEQQQRRRFSTDPYIRED